MLVPATLISKLPGKSPEGPGVWVMVLFLGPVQEDVVPWGVGERLTKGKAPCYKRRWQKEKGKRV